MRILVCHPKKALVQLARLHAEKHGMQVDVAKNGNDLIRRAQAQRPDLIVIGEGLKEPDTEETKRLINAEPTLRGVRVIVTGSGLGPDLGQAMRAFGWPKIPSPPQ